MKPEQVLSIEQMKYLQELGLDTSDASMVFQRGSATRHEWVLHVMGYADVSLREKEFTYTLQDILDKLPPIIDEVYWLTLEVMDRRKNEWKIKYVRINEEHECVSFSSEKLIDAAYEMLCWCIENRYIKTKE